MDLVRRSRRRVAWVAERAWIKGAQQGSVADLELLFREHWPRAFRAARLVTGDAAAAEDIAQEAFLAAVRNLDRFDRRRPFGPWLHRIVVNRAIDWTRARKLRAEVELGDHVAAPSRSRAGTAERSRASRELPPEQRAVIVLRYVLEYTPGEIARAARPAARHRQLAASPRPRSAEGAARVTPEDRAWEIVPPRLRGADAAAAAAATDGYSARRRGRRGSGRRGCALATRPRRLRTRPRRGRRRARGARALLAARRRPAARRLAGRPHVARRAGRAQAADLGAYDDAAWSPHGLYLAATRGERARRTRRRGERALVARAPPTPPAPQLGRARDVDTRIAYDAGERPARRRRRRHRRPPARRARRAESAPAWDPARHFTRSRTPPAARSCCATTTATLALAATLPVTPDEPRLVDRRPLACRRSHPRACSCSTRPGSVRRTVSMLGARHRGRRVPTGLAPARGRHPARPAAARSRRRPRPPGTREARCSQARAPSATSPGRRTASWLLVDWPAANQWVFLHGCAARTPSANIRAQFGERRRTSTEQLVLRSVNLGACSRSATPSRGDGLPRTGPGAHVQELRRGRAEAARLLSRSTGHRPARTRWSCSATAARHSRRRRPAGRHLARLAWTHIAWTQVLDLNFGLLSDFNGEAVRAFGVGFEYRGFHDVARRSAFLVDEQASCRRPGSTTRARCPMSTRGSTLLAPYSLRRAKLSNLVPPTAPWRRTQEPGFAVGGNQVAPGSHAHRVVAGVDVQRRAGDVPGAVAEQVRGRCADIVRVDVAMERRSAPRRSTPSSGTRRSSARRASAPGRPRSRSRGCSSARDPTRGT